MPLTLKVAVRSRRDEAYLYIIITVGRHRPDNSEGGIFPLR